MWIEETINVAASRERVWRLVGDPGRYPRFMADISRWERSGAKRKGLGARYQVRLHAGSADLGGEIEVVELDEGWELAWNSVRGIEHRGRWRIRDGPKGGTEVTFRLIYGIPSAGGVYLLTSLLADQLSAPLLRASVRRTLGALRDQVEAEAPAPATERSLATTLVEQLETLDVFGRAGLLRPLPADRLFKLGLLVSRWGVAPAAGFAAGAIAFPGEAAVVDELGALTFEEVDERANAVAHGLNAQGVGSGSTVAVMCRNHRGFVEAVLALWKLGANCVLLNTAFAAPQLAEVVRREKARAIIYDAEFEALVKQAGRGRKRFWAWADGPPPRGVVALEQMIAEEALEPVPPPERPGRTVILTSGTTGAPKGARRTTPSSLSPALALLSKIPLRRRDTTFIAAPLFHSWGFSHLTLGLLLSTTVLVRRRFDPEATLKAIEEHRPSVLVAVPVMLQRILELPARVRRRYDTSSLRVVAVSGSSLPAELANRFMDEFGDILYNLYGSTEVAWATIATPEDLREAPGTAGKAPSRTLVRVYDDLGREVPTGVSGRIFVGNDFQFEGYTGGGGKPSLDGLLATGDVGHQDSEGRLFVEGREDEMIVSGGENVYPAEVEDLLSRHPKVAEVAVVGVDDERFGQSLKAYIVKKGALGEEQVKSYVRANLARFKIPRQVEFVKELPRNATGKVMKRDLAGRRAS